MRLFIRRLNLCGHRVAKIQELENKSLWQKLKSFQDKMLNSFIFVIPTWCTTTERLNQSVDEDEDQFLIAIATH